MKRVLSLGLVLVALALALSGCRTLSAISVMSKMLGSPKAGDKIADDKIVVIGRIRFDPEPVQDIKATRLSLSGGDAYTKKVDLAFTKDPARVVHFGKDDADHLAEVPWTEPFVFQFPREAIYLKAVMFATKTGVNNTESDLIPCTVNINADAGEKVIYVGDITFQFGKANSMGGTTDSVQVVDGFDSVKAAYDGAFLDSKGNKLSLVKHLAGGDGPVVVQKTSELWN